MPFCVIEDPVLKLTLTLLKGNVSPTILFVNVGVYGVSSTFCRVYCKIEEKMLLNKSISSLIKSYQMTRAKV